MAYLVRRLLENTSNESFLYEQARGTPLDELLGGACVKPFANEPILELRRAPVRAQLAGALEAFDEEPVIQVPVWVGDDARTGGALAVERPRRPGAGRGRGGDRVRGRRRPRARSRRRARDWRRRTATERAEVLIRAAQWLRERRLEIAALEVRETAKPWREADGDVCEAIDFLEYYARGAIALEERPAGDAELIQLARRAQRAALAPARRSWR